MTKEEEEEEKELKPNKFDFHKKWINFRTYSDGKDWIEIAAFLIPNDRIVIEELKREWSWKDYPL